MIKFSFLGFILLFSVIINAGCNRKPAVADAPLISSTHKDATGFELRFEKPPKKVISLSQSITLILNDLGALSSVTSVSEDTEIQWDGATLPTVPFPSNTDMTVDTLKILKPEVIFADKDQFLTPDAFRKAVAPSKVFFFDLTRMEGFFNTVKILGNFMNQSALAEQWITQMQIFIKKIEEKKTAKGVTCAMITAYDSIQAVGGNNYLNDILTACGGKNVFADRNKTLLNVTADELVKLQPDFIFILTENPEIGKYLIKNHPAVSKLKALEKEQVLTADPNIYLRPSMNIYQAYAQIAVFLSPKLDVKKLYEEAFPQNEVAPQ